MRTTLKRVCFTVLFMLMITGVAWAQMFDFGEMKSYYFKNQGLYGMVFTSNYGVSFSVCIEGNAAVYPLLRRAGSYGDYQLYSTAEGVGVVLIKSDYSDVLYMEVAIPSCSSDTYFNTMDPASKLALAQANSNASAYPGQSIYSYSINGGSHAGYGNQQGGNANNPRTYRERLNFC